MSRVKNAVKQIQLKVWQHVIRLFWQLASWFFYQIVGRKILDIVSIVKMSKLYNYLSANTNKKIKKKKLLWRPLAAKRDSIARSCQRHVIASFISW